MIFRYGAGGTVTPDAVFEVPSYHGRGPYGI
jgi:hypothetical protein